MTHGMYYLRTFRKRSRLTQYDIAFLLGLPEHTNVCHWESGRRSPSLEVSILYHLLFEIPQAKFFEEGNEPFIEEIVKRIPILLDALRSQPMDSHVQSRIAFLEATLSRLSNPSI